MNNIKLVCTPRNVVFGGNRDNLPIDLINDRAALMQRSPAEVKETICRKTLLDFAKGLSFKKIFQMLLKK